MKEKGKALKELDSAHKKLMKKVERAKEVAAELEQKLEEKDHLNTELQKMLIEREAEKRSKFLMDFTFKFVIFI